MSFETVLGFWCWDVKRDKLFAEATVCEYFGLLPEEGVEGVSLTAFIEGIHRSDRRTIVDRIGAATANGSRFSETYRVVSAKHGTKTIQSIGFCFRDSSGRPSYYPGVVTESSVAYDVAPIHVEIADHLVRAKELSEVARELLLGRLIDAVLLETGQRLAARIKAMASGAAGSSVIALDRLEAAIGSPHGPIGLAGSIPVALGQGAPEPVSDADARKTAIRLQPIQIALPASEGRGVLVYNGAKLVAVLAQMGEEAGDRLVGSWTIEAGFDHMGFSTGQIFGDLEEAQDWIKRRVR
ncbi:PAS domain-containing protein [Aureimonas sp. AU12]|uniref:PAS domain-containing protein n=1 Tax=Aureimonas sp. AU12 TaxID=1638161 RepID=UPI0009EB9584|nr:PAS domain-containing protein [Aureimonas sp. AU12]